jgi:protein SEY1
MGNYPVLRNPLYFFLLSLLCVGAYVTYQLNLWGPIINMANAASAQALEEGKKRLREFLEASETGRQAMAMQGGESYEMSRMNGTGTRGKSVDYEDAEEEEDI